MSRTVTFNNAFFRELANDAGVVALCVEKAEAIAARARATAPVDSGDYRDGIIVKVIPEKDIRTVALVVGTDPKTMLIESKTGNLARALKAAGRGR